ncbi:MAG: ATP-dependent Clp protease adaptor ClpS [Bacteroidales bacterium]
MNIRRKYEEDSNYEMSPNDGKDYSLILFNDDLHDFNYVISSLIEVCKHDEIQAEQCTYLVHYSGKCQIKKGKFNQLNHIKKSLLEKGLTVELM